MNKRRPPEKPRKFPSRNTAALVLFGRSVVITLSIVSGCIGFYAGIQSSSASYNPHNYATGAGALFAAACAVIAFMLTRRRATKVKLRALELRIEELSDRNWELREAEVRARSLLEAQGDLIIRRDAQGLLTYANDAYCTLAGKSRAQLLGQPAALTVHEQGPATMLADGTRAHDQKIAMGDNARWVAWREVAVRTETGTEVQGVGRDVTDRVEAERAFAAARDLAEAANRAKSRFLAMVSHEIRTPLNGLLGMADLLLDTSLTPEQLTYAKAAKTSGETLLSLIEEVLDFSKIEAGKLDLEPRPFALVPLVEEAVELLAPRAQAKGIEIASYIDGRLPATIVGDAARLRQAAQSCRQCGEIHRARRRRGYCRTGRARRRHSISGARYRHWSRATRPGARVSRFRAGRRFIDPQIRRHWPRPRHFQTHRRAHARFDRGGEPAWPRFGFQLHGCPAVGVGRPE